MAACVLLAACSDTPAEPRPEPILLLIDAVAYAPPNNLDQAIEGVEICVVEPAGGACTTTDTDGTAFFENMLGATRTRIRLVADGYVTSYRDFVTPRRDHQQVTPMVGEPLAEAFADLVGVPYPIEAGVIAFDTETLAGVDVAVSPSVGEAVHYLDETGVPDTALMATSTTGIGFITGLPDGEYELTFPGCRDVDQGVPGGGPGRARTQTTAGAISFVTMICR